MTETAPTVPALPMTSAFIATTPADMQRAQDGMIAWCDKRIEEEKNDIADLERTIAEAQRASINDKAWKRRLSLSRAKITFYRKTKGALLKGFYIVPPFPVQLFAIRTHAHRPPRGDYKSYQHDAEQKPMSLPEGEGDWQSPFPKVESRTWKEPNQAGQLVDKTYWRSEYWLGVDFPFKLVKPEIIAAVRGAIEDKLFDALGVLPRFRSADPIVVGQIIPPHRKHDPLNFFVAWWLDPREL